MKEPEPKEESKTVTTIFWLRIEAESFEDEVAVSDAFVTFADSGVIQNTINQITDRDGGLGDGAIDVVRVELVYDVLERARLDGGYRKP